MDPFPTRLRIIYGIIFLLALALLGKLFFVQILQGNAFSARADRQYVSPISNSFDRGSIFFQTKEGNRISAATLKTGFTVALNGTVLPPAQEVYPKIFPFLPELKAETFFLKAGKKDDPYEEIAWRVPEEQIKKIEELKIPGIIMQREKWRFYPGQSLAAHALGFVGFKDETLGGRYGLERYYEDVLQRSERELYVNFFAEVFANIEHSLFYKNSREGDLVLGIEPEVQRTLEKTLQGVMSEWSADSAGAVIMNPKTGSIYALAAVPTFDPNLYGEEEDYQVFSNPIVEGVFEMGSIVKPLTVAMGIDAGVIKPQSVYTDTGMISLDGFRIGNYDGKARGTVSMQEVLNQSLNTGAIHVMQKLGKERFAKYFLSLGLGQETGIDLPNEIPGLVKNLESTREIEYATASFGQGVAVTPIAMVRALSALANGGVLITPHIVEETEYTLSSSRKAFNENPKRVFKEETVEDVTRMLVKVVDDALVGGEVKLEHFSIAAKTGTAQMALPEGGGYYKDRFLHSFFGYFPAYDPQFMVFFYMVYPKGVSYASQTLTTPFMKTAKFLLNYYEVPPDR